MLIFQLYRPVIVRVWHKIDSKYLGERTNKKAYNPNSKIDQKRHLIILKNIKSPKFEDNRQVYLGHFSSLTARIFVKILNFLILCLWK